MKVPLILATVLSLSVLMQGARSMSQEDKLVAHLLQQLQPVGKIARPVSDASANVTITMGLSLIQISSVKDNSAEMDVWLQMRWTDPRLQWNAFDYGGLSTVSLPADMLWLPDIAPYDGVKFHLDKQTASRVVIFSDGSVVYVPQVQLKVSMCWTLKNRSVTCEMKLGSWVYSGNQVDLKLSKDGAFDLSSFVVNDWEVTSAVATREDMVYPCCPEPYISIKYKLMMKRTDKSSKKSKKSKSSKKSHESK